LCFDNARASIKRGEPAGHFILFVLMPQGSHVLRVRDAFRSISIRRWQLACDKRRAGFILLLFVLVFPKGSHVLRVQDWA
jgi:hypothetical protein